MFRFFQSVCAASIVVVANNGRAADRPDFGGKYRNVKHPDFLLVVVQTADSVAVTTAKLRERLTRRYPLAGGPADCS